MLQVKRDAFGNHDRFKAPVVAGKNYQTYVQNYLETYSPVVDFSIVRLFLYLVVYFQQYVFQIDMKTAFLNGNLTEDVWVVLPRGISGRPPKVYKLKKALYGLKQAHLAWHTKLYGDLERMSFSDLARAFCVFVCDEDSSKSFVLIYVEDLLVIGKKR